MKYSLHFLGRMAIGMGLIFSSALLQAQTTFYKLYGGASTDSGRDVELTSDGAYLIAGHTKDDLHSPTDVYLIKTNQLGDQVWSKRIGGSGLDMAYAIKKTSDGNYIIAGHSDSYSNGIQNMYLVKVDESGNVLWEKNYGGSKYDVAEAVLQTDDGGYIVAGGTCSTRDCIGTTDADIFVVKTDASGNVQWSKNYGGPLYDYARGITKTADGGYVVIGHTANEGAGSTDIYLIKLSADGNVVWSKTYGGIRLEEGKHIQTLADGGFIFIGDSDSFSGNKEDKTDVYVIRIDANGNKLWEKLFGGDEKDVAKTIYSTPDGGYVIAGITRSFGLINPDGWIIKTDASGNEQWENKFGGVGHEHFYAAKPTPDGGYIVVGHSADSYGNLGQEDVYLLKLNQNGEITSVKEQLLAANYDVYPNPSVNSVTITFQGAPVQQVKILDISGRPVFEEKVNMNDKNFEHKIDLSGLSKGLYIVGIQASDCFITKKVLVQ